jgi:hypothetical protein
MATPGAMALVIPAAMVRLAPPEVAVALRTLALQQVVEQSGLTVTTRKKEAILKGLFSFKAYSPDSFI